MIDSERQRILPVCLPAGSALAGAAPGSAIIADLACVEDDDVVCVGVEGAIYGQSGMASWADRALYAHDVVVYRRPSMSRRHVPAGQLAVVGEYDPVEGQIVLHAGADRAAICAWLSVAADELDEQLLSTSPHHRERRLLRERLSDPTQRLHTEFAIREVLKRHEDLLA